MSLELTEKEMLDRFEDSMKKASDAADIIATAIPSKKPKAFQEFVHSLKIAAGSAHQLAIYRENLTLLTVRDTLEKVIEQTQKTVSLTNNAPTLWLSIRDSLNSIKERALKSANSKATPRIELLTELEYRNKNLPGLNTDV